MRVFENRVLRRIFGAMLKRETGKWRKLQKVLYCQYCSTVVARVININENKICRACGTYGGEGTRIQEIDGEIRGKEYTWETQA